MFRIIYGMIEEQIDDLKKFLTIKDLTDWYNTTEIKKASLKRCMQYLLSPGPLSWHPSTP